MDNTPTQEERLDKLAEEASEKMLAGEDTPWLEREPHRGEAPQSGGGEYLDPVEQGAGMSGGGHGGTSGSNQVFSSATGGGATGGGSHANQGDDVPGAFGEETGGDAAFDDAAGMDNAIKKLQGLS